jgi:hypothetical protein
MGGREVLVKERCADERPVESRTAQPRLHGGMRGPL